MAGGATKRIGLFLLIFGVPLLFLVILSRGDMEYSQLKYYANTITEEGSVKVNDFLFYDVDSNEVTKETLEGKSLIVTTLIPSCPTACPVLFGKFGLGDIYKDVLYETDLSDFIMLSHVIDTNGKQVDLQQFAKEQPVDKKKWKLLVGPESNPLYDFKLPKANLKDNHPTDKAVGGKTYYKMILLIDKNHYLRGIYQGDKTKELKRLQQEIKVLRREYKEEKKRLKEQNK